MPPDVQVAPVTQTHIESATLETPKLPRVLLPLNQTNCFGAQSWHVPYAEALIEEVLPFLPIAITLAERAIMNRYFELNGSIDALEEHRDLWRAVEELQKLRRKLVKTSALP